MLVPKQVRLTKEKKDIIFCFQIIDQTRELTFEGENSRNFPRQNRTVNATSVHATQRSRWKVQRKKTFIHDNKLLRGTT